jgi:hypothetical protein
MDVIFHGMQDDHTEFIGWSRLPIEHPFKL